MNHRHLLTALKLLLAAIVMVAIGTSEAHGGDSKIYPGLMCVNYLFRGAPGYEYGAIGNYSITDILGVGCPIVHDAASLNNGRVQVLDRHGAQDVQCRVLAASRSGNAITAKYSEWQYSASVGGIQLSFGGLTPPTSLSHYYYYCVIPPMTASGASFVVSYQATENE